jgi:hypothetical protein
MGIELKEIVPWGRSFEEYAAMFALSEADLQKRIVGCGDGPASFNAELTARGGRVISVDPIYAFGADEIRRRVEETFETIMAGMPAVEHKFVWSRIRNIWELGEVRMRAMDAFLDDYDVGKTAGRHIAGEFPKLPLPDNAGDLALCSHLLFLYSKHLSESAHLAALDEMLRVAPEARVFPLVTLDGDASPHLEPVIAHLRAAGHAVSIEQVPYEFQKGANRMLRVRRKT